MDPRPYNYEFRKPRLNNRTYQSYNAYESLYHMGKVDPSLYYNNFMKDEYQSRLNRYSSVYQNPYSNGIPQQSRNAVQPQQPSKQFQSTAINTDNYSNKASSNRSVKSRSSSLSEPINPSNLEMKPSVLSTYGSNVLQKNQNQLKPQNRYNDKVNLVFSHQNDSAEVFLRQQKHFDIINHYSKGTQPLRKYPKLHLEDRLLQRAMDINN